MFLCFYVTLFLCLFIRPPKISVNSQKKSVVRCFISKVPGFRVLLKWTSIRIFPVNFTRFPEVYFVNCFCDCKIIHIREYLLAAHSASKRKCKYIYPLCSNMRYKECSLRLLKGTRKELKSSLYQHDFQMRRFARFGTI